MHQVHALSSCTKFMPHNERSQKGSLKNFPIWERDKIAIFRTFLIAKEARSALKAESFNKLAPELIFFSPKFSFLDLDWSWETEEDFIRSHYIRIWDLSFVLWIQIQEPTCCGSGFRSHHVVDPDSGSNMLWIQIQEPTCFGAGS